MSESIEQSAKRAWLEVANLRAQNALLMTDKNEMKERNAVGGEANRILQSEVERLTVLVKQCKEILLAANDFAGSDVEPYPCMKKRHAALATIEDFEK